jgi:hypothetical protein
VKKRWRNTGLYVLLVIVFLAVGSAFLDRPDPANATRTLRYSDFIEAVQGNEISRVLISPDRGTAQVIENDGKRAEVNLAASNGLYLILLLFSGIVVPLSSLPSALRGVVLWFPSAAMADVVHTVLGSGGTPSLRDWVALTGWALLAPLLAARTFRFD